jgi:hypothetical protein
MLWATELVAGICGTEFRRLTVVSSTFANVYTTGTTDGDITLPAER